MEFWTAFTIGLFGSLHCIGMCGPIAFALPVQDTRPLGTILKILLYNFGRVLTYSFIGLVIGLLGSAFHIAGMQKIISIFLGVLMLVAVFFSIQFETSILKIPLVDKLVNTLKSNLSSLLKTPTFSNIFTIGILNGFLPCGLVYLAVAGAISSQNPLQSVTYMALFGTGTIPMMLLISVAGNFVSLRFRNAMRKLIPVFLFVFAFLFLMRGLNFDMPTDIILWQDADNIPMCH